MAKYKLKAMETFETIIPESNLIYTNFFGEQVDSMPVPERRWMTHEGEIRTAKNQKERDSLLKTGKWQLI